MYYNLPLFNEYFRFSFHLSSYSFQLFVVFMKESDYIEHLKWHTHTFENNNHTAATSLLKWKIINATLGIFIICEREERERFFWQLVKLEMAMTREWIAYHGEGPAVNTSKNSVSNYQRKAGEFLRKFFFQL